MSYSVNFSENVSGKIVLGNVVMNGSIYTPSADTQVFTKDLAGNLMKNTALDLTGITYTPTGTTPVGTAGVVASVVTTGVPKAEETTAASTSVGTSEKEAAATLLPPPTAVDEALNTAQSAILAAITSARSYKVAKFPIPESGGSVLSISKPPVPIASPTAAIAEVSAAITAVDTAITAVDTAIVTKYAKTKTQLEATKLALAALNDLLDKFNTASPPSDAIQENLESAINNVQKTHDELFNPPIRGGAPLRFGSSSSKTKRNRRRNRRFAKKSYKRRH